MNIHLYLLIRQRAIQIAFTFFFFYGTQVSLSQSTVQPTPVAGSNSVSFNAGTNKYQFFHNGIVRYEYSIVGGGSFKAITAYADNGTSFFPSNDGISAMLGGVKKYPSDYPATLNYILLNRQILLGDTVLAYWAMIANTDTFRYTYKMKIVGRTLVICILADSTTPSSNKATGINLGQCEQASSPFRVVIPYMNLFAVLSSNGIYTAFFADWERTNTSLLWPINPGFSSTIYAQWMEYVPKTNGVRNRLQETFYLTTSPTISDVLPNIPNPVSSYKDTSANHIVWDYRQPFARLIRAPWNHLDSLWHIGVGNIWLQIHDWQYDHPTTPSYSSGYDDGLPATYPANSNHDYGGTPTLDSVINKARFSYGYRIGLHENYVDYYEDASDNPNCGLYGYHPEDRALNSDGTAVNAYFNTWIPMQSWLLKPSKAAAYVSYWSSKIQEGYNINGCYLDVHSASNPSGGKIDYDASVPNAGKFTETLLKYRELYPILRANHHGPVQGEGDCHFLYIGYVDDIEARLTIPQSNSYGKSYNFPLFVDFDLLKLHSKTMVHGVCYYPFFNPMYDPNLVTPPATRDIVLSYIATELAYGHGGYLPDPWETFDIGKHAQLEYMHVFSVQNDYANATPTSIEYWDGNGGGPYTASSYIATHPYYADINNATHFMGRVKITYDNGVIVCVNRNPQPWQVTLGSTGGWYNYHAIIGSNNDSLYTGTSTTTTFTLPANNGWVVYDPLKTNVTFKNKIRSSNAGGYLLLDATSRVASGDSRSLTVGSSHAVQTLNERFTPLGDSIYKHHDWKSVALKFRMKDTLQVTPFPAEHVANFTGLNPVAIRNELLDGPSVNGGIIQFRDPWYLHSNGTQPDSFFTYNLSTVPFKPTGAYNYTTGGVFLNQGDTTDLQPPYYSVRVPRTQTIGSYQNCNFIEWSATDATLSPLQYPFDNESAVVFRSANDIVKAKYKGNLLSSNSAVSGPNNTRKIMYDDAGAYHLVYESSGEIWYTKSTDNGQSWINELKISNRNLEHDNKNPSVYCYTANSITYVQVTWIQGGCINYKEYASNSGWGGIHSLCNTFDGGGPPSLLPSIANPVVYNGYIAFEYPKDAAGETTAIAVARWPGNEWIYTTDMPGVSTQVKRPAIVYESYKVHLVCQDAGSIKYNAVLLNNNTLQWVYTTSNISDGSNRTSNSAPSITAKGSYLFAAWEGLNASNSKKEIVIRKKALSGSWLSFDYIGSDATCNSGVNFYAPSINQVSSTQVGLVWQDANGASWASRYSENDGVWYKYKLVESNSMNPTLSNNATGDGKVMYTQSSASAPYALKFSSIPSGTPRPTLYQPSNGAEGVGLGIWLGWYCVSGATSYRVQVSTEFANFESGIIKDQSGITATSYQPGGLTYSTTYYWRVSAKLFNVIDGDWSDIWSFRTMDYSPPGCPYVFSKIGNDFIIDNNILPQSEYPGNKNKDVTDYYKLLASPTSDNGKYIIEVREFERERSQIDEIKLLAVDHYFNTDIAVLPNGEIIEYLPAFRLAPDESKGNFEKLSTLEGKAFITDRNDEFLLHFEPVLEGYLPDDLSTMEGGLLLGGWIVRGDKYFQKEEPPPPEKKISVGMVGGVNRGVVGSSSSFTFRERATLVYVPLEKLATQVNVRFLEKTAFDFALLVVKVPTSSCSVHDLILESAKHSKVNDVTTKISGNDGVIEELYPDESIRLTYNAVPLGHDKVRSFILAANGRYERIEGDHLTRVPAEFQLEKNYPNPFNPQTTIRYQLAKPGNVQAVIYNQLGQELIKLVDTYQDVGYYEKTWNASDAPSGIYYIRMSVADQFGKQLYQATHKLIVMK